MAREGETLALSDLSPPDDGVLIPDAARGELQRRLSTIRDAYGVPGVSVSMRKAGRAIDVSAGVASARELTAFSPHERVPVSCVMKVLVSVLALHAEERGVLNLNDAVERYVPQLAEGGGITLKHLLTHTAGYIEPQANSARWGYRWSDFVAFFPTRKQAFVPGTVWSYSHTGIVLLQKALEFAHGRPIEQLLKEELLEPLGLELEFYGEMKSGQGDLARLHVRVPRGQTFEPMRPPRETGFLRYSISDAVMSSHQLARLAAFLAGEFRVERPHLERAIARLGTHAIDLPAYTLGPEGEKMPIAFCHGMADYGAFRGVNGSYVGSTCAMRLGGADGLGIATVVNAYAPHLRDVVTDMLSSAFAPTSVSRLPRRAMPIFDPAELVGRYEGLMLGAADAAISRDDDVLTCTLNFKRGVPAQARFRQDADGQLQMIAGSRDIALALARDPASGEPYLMATTSAFKKCS